MVQEGIFYQVLSRIVSNDKKLPVTYITHNCNQTLSVTYIYQHCKQSPLK